MADFNAAHNKMLGNEGGYANNPDDAGGETYKGISRRFWPQWGGWKYVDGVKANTVQPPERGTAAYQDYVAHLNRCLAGLAALQQLVVDFYKKNFWDKCRLGEVNDQAVADWLYDHAVNGGNRGVMWMQEAVGVKADGVVGPQTIRAINAVDPKALLDRVMDIAVAYRMAKVQDEPDQRQFLHSWLERDGLPEERIKQVMATA